MTLASQGCFPGHLCVSLFIPFYIPLENYFYQIWIRCHISAQNNWTNDKLINKTFRSYLSRLILTSQIDTVHSNSQRLMLFLHVPCLIMHSFLLSRGLSITIWLCSLGATWKSLNYHKGTASETPPNSMSDMLLKIFL